MTGSPTGVRIGHWTDPIGKTGCTVVLFDQLTQTVVDIRGAAPGSRETDLLAADKSVGAVDAILLTGGSAHGLAAADGVMSFLRDVGRGVPTLAGAIPIVTAAVIYDLGVGKPVWPTAEAGLEASGAAVSLDDAVSGSVGAGIGATYRKAWPGLAPYPGGVGIASKQVAGLGTAWAIVVLNAIGDAEDHRDRLLDESPVARERENTTLMAIVLNGPADGRTLRRCAVASHDGLARMIKPAHTQFDGDAAFVSALNPVDRLEPAQSFRWTVATELAVEAAIHQVILANDH
jgi:L-aminopeptidase/D-esterase-like protein